MAWLGGICLLLAFFAIATTLARKRLSVYRMTENAGESCKAAFVKQYKDRLHIVSAPRACALQVFVKDPHHNTFDFEVVLVAHFSRIELRINPHHPDTLKYADSFSCRSKEVAEKLEEVLRRLLAVSNSHTYKAEALAHARTGS